MKYIIILLALSSCTKDWSCTITTSSQFGNIESTVDFRGTNKEKAAFEASGTGTTEMFDFGSGTYYDINQVTNCVPD